MDSAPTAPLTTALLINIGLLGLFAVQHNVMARPAFKRLLTRVVPQAAERSTYVLASSLALILLFWLWSPLGGVIWDVQDPVGRTLLYGAFASGWLLVLVTTFIINHFDLFGLRQVCLHLLGRPYERLRFVTPGPYRLVRHPSSQPSNAGRSRLPRLMSSTPATAPLPTIVSAARLAAESAF